MTLPTPRLDDRTFQQLVDEAKRQVQQRCPAWTDHNVSDPGVTLIETFAWMTEMLLYRLNRVPDQLYVRFLEMVGVRLFPPQAAHAEMSFRLSAHQPIPVRIPAGTVVSTRRTVQERAISFTTVRDLDIEPAVSVAVARRAGGDWVDLTPVLGFGVAHPVFSAVPQLGDALYVGLDRPAPGSIVLVQFVCSVGGHGIDPTKAPLVWEAWTPQGWVNCEVQRDDTRGLNVSGGVELHVPATHQESVVSDVPSAWLRCRVVDVPLKYRSSPQVLSVTASTVGGDVEVINAEPIAGELLGISDGTTGQRFLVDNPPILPDPNTPMIIDAELTPVVGDQQQTTGGPDQPAAVESVRERWRAVEDFAASGPEDRHFVVDPTTGEIRFGPAVRMEDGELRRFGAVPPRGALLRLGFYRTGGGAAGNVAAGTITALRTSIPYVASVYNREAARGGVDGETVDEARGRGPLELRRRNRAVTAEDFVTITLEAAPELARAHCVPITQGPDAGALRVLIVPRPPTGSRRAALKDLRLPAGARQRVVSALDRARLVGTRVIVEPPSYIGVRVDARVRARRGSDPVAVERDATQALFDYFSPYIGGPDREGWPLGRPVQANEVYAVLARVPGLDYVEAVALFRADPRDKSILPPVDRIDLAETNLVLSVEHQVDVELRIR